MLEVASTTGLVYSESLFHAKTTEITFKKKLRAKLDY